MAFFKQIISLRKLSLLAIAIVTLFSSASAYDTKGKFGMGIKVWGTPIMIA